MRDTDAVFRALSDPARRRLLDRLNERNGLTLTELCADMGMTRQSVSKHLDVLEEADLVTTLRRGREKLHYLNAAPINEIADRFIHHYDRARVEALADLRTALEATPMDQKSNETSFVYTTYIHATPERVWQGLTDPTFTERYWRHPKSGGVSYRTDWQKGSAYDIAYDRSVSSSPIPSRWSSSPTPPGVSPTPGTPSARSGPLRISSTRPRSRPGGRSRVRRSPSTSKRRGRVW